MTGTRAEILQLNSVLAAHLARVQKIKYEPSEQWAEGDSAILDDPDTVVVLTKALAAQLNRQEKQYYEDNRDPYPGTTVHEPVGNATFVSVGENPREYLNAMARSLAALSQQLRLGRLIILGDWNTPWLSQQNDYLPVANALKYLRNYIDDTFNGGFLLENNDIIAFIPHLFWLTRCNAGLPEFMMAFEASETVATICKYGILHLEFYDRRERDAILKFYNEKGFRHVDRCTDPVAFNSVD